MIVLLVMLALAWSVILRAETRLWLKATSDTHALLVTLWSTAILVGLADATTSMPLIAASATYYAADIVDKGFRPDVARHHCLAVACFLTCVMGGRPDLVAWGLQIEWSVLPLNAWKRRRTSRLRYRVLALVYFGNRVAWFGWFAWVCSESGEGLVFTLAHWLLRCLHLWQCHSWWKIIQKTVPVTPPDAAARTVPNSTPAAS